MLINLAKLISCAQKTNSLPIDIIISQKILKKRNYSKFVLIFFVANSY